MERIKYLVKNVVVALLVVGVVVWWYKHPAKAGDTVGNVMDIFGGIIGAIGTFLNRVT